MYRKERYRLGCSKNRVLWEISVDLLIYKKFQSNRCRQNARFGDSYWSEDKFWRYLLRILTSWAIVYDITYLEPQQKRPGESKQDFAQRVQKVIADTYANFFPPKLQFTG